MTHTGRVTIADNRDAVRHRHPQTSASATPPQPSEHLQANSLAVACQGEQEARRGPIHPVKGRLLHTHQVAHRLGMSQRTVQSWADLGLLRGFKMGKLWCFWEKDIDDFIQKKSEADPSE